MDAILNNPFRILGLPTTASDKEIAKRVSDLLIYAEMGKKVSYETDFPFLGELDRSTESIKLAAKKIELPENKIFYSLLCFDLKDNFERESIEFLVKGDFEAAINVLKNEIYNNCPIIYKSENTVAHILKNFKRTFTNKEYIVTLGPPKALAESIFTKIKNSFYINIYKDDGIVDIQEGYSEINLTDKYQIACSFKWVENQDKQDISIGLGFIDGLDVKYFIQLSNKGAIKFFKSDHLEMENEIDKTVFHETKSNYLALLRYENCIEVRFNGKVPLKIEITESFKSSFLCFSGKQKVLIEDLSISCLKHFQILGIDDEINKNTFSYSKNISIIHLLEILKKGKVGSKLINYFDITGNFVKQPYFITYTKEIISNNYRFNLDVLADIFVEEFCSSLKHLINKKDDLAQAVFIDSFLRLSDDSKNKVIDILSNSKPYLFENFIKDISKKRLSEPDKAYDFACELKNEAIQFFTWYAEIYTEYHNFRNLESQSISDKIGNEILECSIAYYNAISPKTIEIAKQSLKLMTWASDFAFNQALRDRINESISILLKAYPNTEYKIVDFGFKDRTRTTRRVIPKDKPAEAKTNKLPQQEANTKKNEPTVLIRPPRKLKLSLRISDFVIIAIIIGTLYLVFTNSNNTKTVADIPNNPSGVISNKIIPANDSRWIGNKLQNGVSPYDGAFGKGVYDFSSKCYLIFKNGNSTDAIVCLENVTTGRTIRNEYIQAGTDYQMTNIPEGIYKVKSFYGNDWNPEKTLNQGAIKGAFDTDFSFSLSDKPDDLVHMNITETNEGISYTTGEITLYTVSNGNMNQRNINSDEFFK